MQLENNKLTPKDFERKPLSRITPTNQVLLQQIVENNGEFHNTHTGRTAHARIFVIYTDRHGAQFVSPVWDEVPTVLGRMALDGKRTPTLMGCGHQGVWDSVDGTLNADQACERYLQGTIFLEGEHVRRKMIGERCMAVELASE